MLVMNFNLKNTVDVFDKVQYFKQRCWLFVYRHKIKYKSDVDYENNTDFKFNCFNID